VYLSQSDAETGLLELIARAERLHKESQEFEARFRECHERARINHPPTPLEKQRTKVLERVGRRALASQEKDLERFRQEYEAEIQQIIEEQKTWRQTEFGSDYGDIPDTNIDSYHIDEIEIGKVRSWNTESRIATMT
jgi:hypothetical protein